MSYEIDRYYNTSHGLELQPDINSGYRRNENGILFLSEWLILRKLNKTMNMGDEMKFYHVVQALRTWDLNKDQKQIDGLFDRGAFESKRSHLFYKEPHDRRKISHDNITAIAACSYLLGFKIHEQIFSYGSSNSFMFDNTFVANPHITLSHPRDVIFLSLLNLPKLTKKVQVLVKILSYILGLMHIISCLRQKTDTSGKLLFLVRTLCFKNIPFTKLCNKLLTKQYGSSYVEEICKIYFQDEDHPINVEARRYCGR